MLQLRFQWLEDMKKPAPEQAVFTIDFKSDGKINILRTFMGGPDQSAYVINQALKLMKGSDPTSFDMCDFCAAFVCASRKASQANYDITKKYNSGGVQILAPNDPYQHLSRDIKWHYVLTKPYRALHIEVNQVLWEERSRSLMQVYSGLFGDYYKHIDGIMQNLQETT